MKNLFVGVLEYVKLDNVVTFGNNSQVVHV